MAEAIVHIMMNEGCDDLFPKKNYKSDVGFDLFAAEDVTLNYNEVKAVSVGFKMEMENGWEAQIRPRSGNALKAGLMVVNSPGTIDPSYRNIVMVILKNTGVNSPAISEFKPINIKRGDKIAQMVIKEVPQVLLIPSKSLSSSDRGEKGFGSSGTVNV